MKRASYKGYILLAFVFIGLSILTGAVSDRIRAKSARLFGSMRFGRQEEVSLKAEVERLRLENRQLKMTVDAIEAIRHQEQDAHYQTLSRALSFSKIPSTLLERRENEVATLFFSQSLSLPAKIVFRSLNHWSSSVWINVGSTSNESLGFDVVERGSPVVVGSTLVGVIDYVGPKESRVRLITDPMVAPAVRAVRGFPQDRVFLRRIQSLMEILRTRKDLCSVELSKKLEELKSKLNAASEKRLAKGVLQGAVKMEWRSKATLLKGIGFNYDFEDAEGPARDLRTGAPLAYDGNPEEAVPLLKAGDLLITSGLDGLFPSGLEVAIVQSITPLREGAYAYDIVAKSLVTDLAELRYVYVLPPLSRVTTAIDPEEKTLPER